MCRRRSALRRKLPTLMMIRRENSESDGGKRNQQSDLTAAPENFREFLRRNYFELRISAISWLFVSSPSAKVRHVTKAASLHVLVCDFQNQFRPQRLPG